MTREQLPRNYESTLSLKLVKQLKPGQSVTIAMRQLSDDFPGINHNGFVFTSADQVLESIVGSCVEFCYRNVFHNSAVEFFRLQEPIKESDTFSYVSPDYRKYYEFDGRLFRRRKVKQAGVSHG